MLACAFVTLCRNHGGLAFLVAQASGRLDSGSKVTLIRVELRRSLVSARAAPCRLIKDSNRLCRSAAYVRSRRRSAEKYGSRHRMPVDLRPCKRTFGPSLAILPAAHFAQTLCITMLRHCALCTSTPPQRSSAEAVTRTGRHHLLIASRASLCTKADAAAHRAQSAPIYSGRSMAKSSFTSLDCQTDSTAHTDIRCALCLTSHAFPATDPLCCSRDCQACGSMTNSMFACFEPSRSCCSSLVLEVDAFGLWLSVDCNSSPGLTPALSPVHRRISDPAYVLSCCTRAVCSFAQGVLLT